MKFHTQYNLPALAVAAFLLAGSAMAHPADRVPDAPEEISPVLIGSTIPEVEVRDLEGKPVGLRAALAGRPAVLVFFRGEW